MTFGGGWGGGGGMFGGGRPGAAVGGLPFGGIPPELQDGVDKLLAEERDPENVEVEFTQIPTETENRPLTLWGLMSEYPGMLVAAAALVVAVSLLSQVGPKLIGNGINDVIGAGTAHHRIVELLRITMVFIVAIALNALCQRSQVKVTGRLAAWVMNDLRVKVFTHIQRLSLDYFTEEKAGVIMTRMTSDIENLQQLLQDGLAQLAVQALTMVVIAVILFATNVRLALITVALVIPALVVLSLWFRKASESGYGRVRDGIANVMADLSESLHGVRIVTAHNRQRFNVVHHRNVVGEYRDANIYTAQINAVYGPGSQVVGWLGQAALLAIGGYMVLHRQLNAGELVEFFLYLNRFFSPIQLLVQQYNTYQQGQASVLKLRTLLSSDPSVPEIPGSVELPEISGEIVFDHVGFSYNPGTPVLSDVTLRIEPSETVAFVGPTGAGKSTMAKLVTRFYDPTEGSVEIDGYDLRAVTLGSLRRQLGVVPQEPFLFAGTIRENIAFARPSSTTEEVWASVDAVGLRDVIEKMPDGLDTVVHERGQSLSSGERQLIALGRAFLAHPRVLVLDEATSNLDLQSETKIESALDVLLQGRTAVLIAHRLSTAMRADRIVVIDEGRVAEVGTPEELLERGGRFAEMYATWSSQSDSQSHQISLADGGSGTQVELKNSKQG